MKLSPVSAGPIRSQGHLGVPPYAVTRVSSSAREPYLSLVTDSKLPAEVTVAMTHEAMAGAAGGPTYVMERRGGPWRYLVVDADGLIRKEGPAECAGCHASGVAESLFGPPRPKSRPIGPAGMTRF